MKLPPELSFPLIEAGGFSINYNTSKTIIAYNYILRNLYNESIDDINEFLRQLSLKTLSDNYR